MAHQLIGVDLGGSRTKVVRYEAGFRKAVLLGGQILPPVEPPYGDTGATAESGMRPDPAAELAARLAALPRQLDSQNLATDELYVALPASELTFRVIDLPFADPRRIEAVLGYELEPQIMTPVEELIVDHVVVGNVEGETRVLVVAAPRELVRTLVDVATAEKLVVRSLTAAPLGLAALYAGVSSEVPGPTLILDLGYDTTTACVIRSGTLEYARSLGRGGRHLDEAIARTLRVDLDAAERIKHDQAALRTPAQGMGSPTEMHLDRCLREALKPLVRELRQTLAAYHASYGAGVERVWLTGGGASLGGLAEYLAAELGVVASAAPTGMIENPERLREAPERLGIALGMAAIGLGTGPRLNFRKGEFAYRSDYSFLRGRALYFGVAMLAILFFAILNAAAALRGLRKEHEVLTEQLKKETQTLFGEPRTDAVAISDELKEGTKGGGPPIPTVTAFDLFDDISRKIPPSEQLKLDIQELDIRPKKTYLKGTAATAQQVDELAEALGKIPCFPKKDVQKGKLRTVTGPAPVGSDGQPGSPVELKQFDITIASTCL